MIGILHTIMRSTRYSRNRVGRGLTGTISLISYYYFIDFIYVLSTKPRRLRPCEYLFHRFHTIMESMKYHLVPEPLSYSREAASVTDFRAYYPQGGAGYGFISEILAGQRRLRIFGQYLRKPAQTINLQKYGLQARNRRGLVGQWSW